MALDRWIAVLFLLISVIYGYTAFFTMDVGLPPFMRFSPVWPSSLPKVLSVASVILCLIVIFGPGKVKPPEEREIDYARLHTYKYGQALLLLGTMAGYAILLRPIGFLAATFLFLAVGGLILGERNKIMLAIVAAIASGAVWYLVNGVLGIFLRPLPLFLGN